MTEPREEWLVRIVYDGPPEAGKTTNIRHLHESLLSSRPGVLSSPGSEGRRTEFFDWREFEGGSVEGHPLRCQILTVPGQATLSARRRHLLASADAVVLVLDASRGHLEHGRATVRSAMRILGDRDVPLVVQLNKLDRPDAIGLEEAADSLRLAPDTPVFGARAREGDGVAATFLAAVRLAVARIEGRSDARARLERTPRELHESLKRTVVP